MRRTPTLPVLAAALALASATLACSSGDDPLPGPGPDSEEESAPRLDIDPRSFYEDYESSEGGGAVGAPAPNAGPGAATAEASAQDSATSFDATEGPSGRAAPGGAGDVAPSEPPVEPPAPGIDEGNTFVDHGANPFVPTAEDPRSTFGLDVDTGSFSVARTFLDQHMLPPEESVRPEEWVNAFGYDDPPPADDAEGAAADLAVTVTGAPAPFADDGSQLVRVGVQARRVEDRPTAHLTFVVDTSGSMDIRERLGLVQSTLALLALELRDDDTVSIVTYGDSSNVVLPPTPAADAETIVAAIGELVPQGSTNMEAGLRTGYEQARSSFEPGAINTVILASDGVANSGITGTDPLSELVRSEGREGIRLVTVGYGMGNYNDDLMEQLADRGDGFYGYVDTYEEAERLFTVELTSTLTVIAEEARAQVAFDPAAVESYRLIGYENRAVADDSFRDDTVDTGELGAGHAVTALYEVHLSGDGPDELGTVTLRHRPVGESEAVEQQVPITTDDLAGAFDEAGDDLRLAGTVAAFAEWAAGHPVAEDRDVGLAALAELAGDLPGSEGEGDEGGAGRADAADLVEMIELAGESTPSGGGGDDGEPLPRPSPTVTVG